MGQSERNKIMQSAIQLLVVNLEITDSGSSKIRRYWASLLWEPFTVLQ